MTKHELIVRLQDIIEQLEDDDDNEFLYDALREVVDELDSEEDQI